MKKHREGYLDRVSKLLFQNAVLLILWLAVAGYLNTENGRFFAAAAFVISFFGQLLCLYFWDTPEKDQPAKKNDTRSSDPPAGQP